MQKKTLKQFKKEQLEKKVKVSNDITKTTTTERQPVIDPSILATGVVSAY